MNTLEIIFTGIVYLLGTANADGGRIQAILPAVMAPVAPFGQVIPEHTAYIKVKKSDIVSPNSVPANFFLQRPNEELFSIYILGDQADHDGDAIGIEAATITPAKLTICKVDQCLNNRLRYDEVVAHREEVCPKCTAIDDQFKTSSDAHLVAARMTIEHGYLAAAKRADDQPWTEWYIKPASNAPANVMFKKQRLAEKVTLDLAAPGPFTIVVTSLKDNTKVRRRITLFSGASVEIGNTSVGDLVLPPRHEEDVDHHFGLFYTMLQWPMPANPPVPIKVQPGDKTLGPRDNCPPLADEEG